MSINWQRFILLSSITFSFSMAAIASDTEDGSTAESVNMKGIFADFGDAPNSYFTAFPEMSDGSVSFKGAPPAYHELTGFPVWLGNGPPPDNEFNGQPSPGADGDDLNGVDDEDGVMFDPIIWEGANNSSFDNDATKGDPTISTMHVNVSIGDLSPPAARGQIACFINAWIDWTGDGFFDQGDQVAFDIPVAAGVPTPIGIPFPNGVEVNPGDTYARVRCSTVPKLGPFGPAPDGEVEDYLITILEPWDYGDAPQSYITAWPPLLLKGAEVRGEISPPRHDLTAFPPVWMGPGAGPDVDPDGQPSPGADGDDLNGDDDEDGVIFDVLQWGGDTVQQSAGDTETRGGSPPMGFMDVVVNTIPFAPTSGKGPQLGCWVSAWIDFGADGQFNPEDQIFSDFLEVGGPYQIPVFQPLGVLPAFGETYARVRCSDTQGMPPFGPAFNGEVEDYVVTIMPPPWDYSDAPLPYPGDQVFLAADSGDDDNRGGIFIEPASHDLSGLPVWLGVNPGDIDPGRLPSPSADADDLDDTPDDEDGVTFDSLIIPDQMLVSSGNSSRGADAFMHVTTGYTPFASSDDPTNGINGCFVSAWIDFNRNGSWYDKEDLIIAGEFVEGFLPPAAFPISIPPNASPGFTYARVRCSQEIKALFNPAFHAPDGEVEDYLVELIGTLPPSDFGDAPMPYPTAEPGLPASHDLTGLAIWLGAGPPPDPEPDGQPSPLANGDDTNGSDDEDGVTFLPILLPELSPSTGSDDPVIRGDGGIGEFTMEVQVSFGGNAADVADRGVPGCRVNAWIDFGRNGSWLEFEDQVVFDAFIPPGPPVPLGFSAPFGTEPGDTYARVRCSFGVGTPSFGPAPEGEVEDYLITINDSLPPEVVVHAQSNPAFLYVPGGAVNITVEVVNTGTEAFTMDGLADSLLGSLHGMGTCVVPRFIPGGTSYQCTYPDSIGPGPELNGRSIGTHVVDNVLIENEAGTHLGIPIHPVPSITVTKTANPNVAAPSGSIVTYNLVISNDNAGVENLTLTAITDDKFGAVAGVLGNCPAVPFIIGAQGGADGLTYACSFKQEISGNDQTTHTNVIKVDFEDVEGTTGQDGDDASVEISDGMFEDGFEDLL